MATPQITLTANLLDYSGVQIGTAARPAYLRVQLCGFGQSLPRVAGTGMLARVASNPQDIPYTGAQISVKLFGNDAITPAGTFYAISVLDSNQNVIQAGPYLLNGSGTFDLSSLPPVLLPGQVSQTISATFAAVPSIAQATGTVDGTNTSFSFSAPSSPSPLISVYAGGVFYSATGGDFTLTYTGSGVWTIAFATAPVNGPVIVVWFSQTGSGERTLTAPAALNVSGLNPDHTVYCNFSLAGAITLPSAATAGAGYELAFIDVSYAAATKNITLSGAVNNGASYVINTNGGAVTLHSDGATWRVRSKF